MKKPTIIEYDTINIKDNTTETWKNKSVMLTTRGRRGRYRMEVGFTTTYTIGAYHH
jgi:hypothetical protein